MALGVAQIPWYATLFRGDQFAAAVAEVAPIAMRYGALDYIVKGHMIGGFAAVAYPAQYGNTGVKTFIVNHDGVVYEKDLGAESASKARAMTRFDPSSDWTAVSN